MQGTHLRRMAGSSWKALEQMAMKSSKPSSSQPNPKVVDLDSSSKPPQTPKSQGKKVASKGRSPPTQDARDPKRSRGGRLEQLHEVPEADIPIISIENLGEIDFERFKKEPMLVCASLYMGVGKTIQDMSDKAQGAQHEKDTALYNLDVARKKLEKALNSKKEALDAKNQAEDEKDKLVKRNKELAAQVKELKSVVSGLERGKADLENKVQEVAGLAKDAAVWQFQNALDQVRVLNGDLGINFDGNMLKPDHYVENNEIVLPEQIDDEGMVVRPRSVLF